LEETFVTTVTSVLLEHQGSQEQLTVGSHHERLSQNKISCQLLAKVFSK
jgi:hypothetical protein